MRNIRETSGFVVNLVDRAMVAPMSVCAIDFPHGIDEIAAAGLATAPSISIAAPKLADSPGQFECRETVSLSLGMRHRNLVVDAIVHSHIRAGIVDERLHVDIDMLDLVGRLHGADRYGTLRDRFQAPRQTMDGWRASGKSSAKAAEGEES